MKRPPGMRTLDPQGRRLGPPSPLRQRAQEVPADERVTVRGEPRTLMEPRTLAPSKKAGQIKPVGVPSAARATKGLSLRKLMRQQPRYIKNSAEDVVIRTLKHTTTKGGLPAITGTTRDLNTKPMRVHKFQVIGLAKDTKFNKQDRIKVSCACEFHCFYSEYALWTWGAANIRYSNGQPANVRNPSNMPIVCKHMMAVLNGIVQHNL